MFGAIANHLKIPTLVGYLIAGIAVGPHTPGFVADQAMVDQLAEIGVILLMFGVGLHFSLKDLLSVAWVAVPGAVLQMIAATGLGMGLGLLLGWSLPASLIFGLALSVASTVVQLRALQERRLVDTDRGRISVGWLVVEDLAMVFVLVLLPALATAVHGALPQGEGTDVGVPAGAGIGVAIAVTAAKIAGFVALMLIVGRRVVPWLLHIIAHTGSRELFRLGVLAIALVVALGAAELFDVSLALGAFFAGLILAESQLSQRAAEESLPLREAFAVLFFVSVGMLFDPMILVEAPLATLAVLAIILVLRSLIAYGLVIALRQSVTSALTVAAGRAQIGEFSFILVELGVALALLPVAGRDLVLAGAIISMLLNPLAFLAAQRLRPLIERDAATAKPDAAATPDLEFERLPEPTRQSGHIVLVGYGRVGSVVGEALIARGLPFLAIEMSERAVAQLRGLAIEVIDDNAARAGVLAAANLAGARQLVVAIPNAFEAGQVIVQARAANPLLPIVARAHSDAEVDYLSGLGADTVIMGEREIARGMIALVDETLEETRQAGLVPV